MRPNSADVVVIGAGVIGCSAAWSLARLGLTVTVLDRGGVAAGASSAAAGMLAPVSESTGDSPFFRMATESLGMFPETVDALRAETGIDPQLVPSGVIRAALTDHEAVELRQRVASTSGFGLEWLDDAAARAAAPGLTHECRGALWSPREAHVLGGVLTRAFATAAVSRRAEIVRGVEVTGLETRGHQVTGVRSAAGSYSAGCVVLCSGAWSGLPLAGLPSPPAVAPVKGEILALRSPVPGFRPIVWGDAVYLVPRSDGTLVVGATTERAGFDAAPTAGGVCRLLADARRLAPVTASCEFLRAWAGLRPGTPDGLPIIGWAPGMPGLIYATGHYRNGILLSPITGRMVAELITSSRGEA